MLIGAFTVCWTVLFLVLRTKDNEVMKALFEGGNLLRLVTVIFIIVIAGYLSFVDRLKPAVTAVFSGIAG